MSTVTPVKAWPDRTGVLHPTIDQWRVAELKALLYETDGSAGVEPKYLDMIAADLVNSQAESLLRVLTTGPRSRPKARRVAGTTNPKRAARRATPAQAAAGIAAMREAVDGATASTYTGTNATKDADVPAEPVPAP